MRLIAAIWAALALAVAPAGVRADVVHAVAFEFPQDRQILFPITINGQAAEAWLDSGSSMTVVDAGFARQLGLQLGEEVRAQGVGGSIPGVRLARADLKMGDLTIPAQRVAVMDLSPVTAVVPRPVQVILGREVFQQGIVQIDFGLRQLSIAPRASFVGPATRPTPLRRSGSLRSFPVVISGVATEAILDFGNSGSLLIDRAFAERHGLLKNRRVSTQLSVGADGARESLILSFDDVQVGGVHFDGVPAVATQNLTTHAPANVGLELLSRYRVTVDFGGDRMWLEPQDAAAQSPFRKNRAGISVLVDGGDVRISHVAPGSPAAAAGWQVGEALAAVDGEPVTPGYRASPLARWTYRPAGTVVRVTMSDGSVRSLTLADYF